MSLRRPPGWALLLMVGLVVVVAWRVATGVSGGDGKKAHVIAVGTMTPIRGDLDVRLTYTADIQPNQQVAIFSRVDGSIAKMHVDKGDAVRAGQILVEIDHTDSLHAVNRAKADLAAARANVVSQEATIKNATRHLARMQSLIKDQYISQQDVDNAQAAYDVAVAQTDAVRAQGHQAEVALQQAETRLAYSYIRAPFSGHIALRNLDQGAVVSGSTGSTSTVSRGILLLQDITTVRVLLDVVEKDVPLVKIGQTAELRADAYPNRVFTGRVTRLAQALDRTTRTMTVDVALPNPDRALKGGMFARVELVAGTHANALQIPIDAITRLESDQHVFIVQDGKARKMPVTLGIQDHRMVEITTGLTGEEPVIVSGKDLVTDGATVDPHPMDAAALPAP